MTARHMQSCKSWEDILGGGPREELGKRIVAKARNAANVARERQRKKTPQQRDPKKEAWAGIVCVSVEGHSLEQGMWLFEHIRVATAILRKEGYMVEPDAYLEGEVENRVFIAGVRFLRLGKL